VHRDDRAIRSPEYRLNVYLTVDAELDTASYPKGIKITDQQMNELEQRALRRHDFHSEWNYSFIPNPP
jgi:hypothetical protein